MHGSRDPRDNLGSMNITNIQSRSGSKNIIASGPQQNPHSVYNNNNTYGSGNGYRDHRQSSMGSK